MQSYIEYIKYWQNVVHAYNLQETYVDDVYPQMGILSMAAFLVRSMYHSTKGRIPGPAGVFYPRHDPANKSRSGLNIYIRQRKSKQALK